MMHGQKNIKLCLITVSNNVNTHKRDIL